ncbi:MAG TPA: hypothetical protein VKX17_15125 [Planctomycetota bacterium]|nr:hypothetical protein [Planctomycetota bacterium]
MRTLLHTALILLFLSTIACPSAEEFDPTKPIGTVKGVASWLGEIPVMAPMELYDQMVVQKVRAGKPLLGERIIVSPDRTFANLVVYVSKGFERFSYEKMSLPAARLENRGMQFVPHVLAMHSGQHLQFVNYEPIAFNWHGVPWENPEWNYSILEPGPCKYRPKLDKPDLGIIMTNDVHGWMRAYACVFAHPFFAVTKEDGQFELHLPPGDYEISFWHERMTPPGKTSRKGYWIDLPSPIHVSVTANETTELNCVVKDASYVEPPASRVEFDPAAPMGTVKGVATFLGEIPEVPPIAPPYAGNANDLALSRQGMPPLRSEEFVVNQDRRVANVVVYVSKGHERFTFDKFKLPPAASISKGLQFVPHVLAMKTGQQVQIVNQDPLMINWHLQAAKNEIWNLAVDGNSTRSLEKLVFDKFELGMRIQCDIYGWMRGCLCVFDHPFFAVTKEDGTFELHLPPGEFEISFWHEGDNRMLPAPQRVLVSADKVTNIECMLKNKEEK